MKCHGRLKRLRGTFLEQLSTIYFGAAPHTRPVVSITGTRGLLDGGSREEFRAAVTSGIALTSDRCDRPCGPFLAGFQGVSAGRRLLERRDLGCGLTTEAAMLTQTTTLCRVLMLVAPRGRVMIDDGQRHQCHQRQPPLPEALRKRGNSSRGGCDIDRPTTYQRREKIEIHDVDIAG